MRLRHSAILGTLFLATLTSPTLRAQNTTPAYTQSYAAPNQTSAPPTAPVKPRNYLALLPAPAFNRTTIVIDPAHGGADSGSRIGDSIVEKDVTLALAFRLRSLLAARGFTVVLTRDSDAANQPTPPFPPLTLDDRAGIANSARASACLLLHATSAGAGVHLYTSELDPSAGEPVASPWLTAQAAWVPQSETLASRISDALGRSRIPTIDGQASIRPLDSLACPALVIELAPNGDDPDSINEVDYQQRVAQAITGALVFWKNAAQPPPHLAPEPATPSAEAQP
jgi:N-acetylmuramoyl-L-alanine amidase